MKIKNLVSSFKKILERFPITTVSILFTTALQVICIDNIFAIGTIMTNIIPFLTYFSVGALLTESVYAEKSTRRKSIYVIFAVISALLTILGHADIGIDFWRISLSYVSILILISIYFLHKHSGKTIEEYTLKVFSNILKSAVTYGILAVGIAVIYAIFVYLIFDIKFTLLARLEILLLGMYYEIRVLYSLVDVEAEVSNFFKGLVKNVLSILVVASFAIIYMYIIKIVVSRDIPKNQIFRILSALFVIGMPIWTMAKHYKTEDLWYKIIIKLPIAFIPFISLQIYSMGIRIIENGFTPARYLSVILIIFEIIYITMYIIKNEKISNLILVLGGLIVISLVVPGVNMFSISNASQYNRLKVYYEKTDYTAEEKNNIYSAYEYLKHSVDGNKYLSKLSQYDIEKITGFHNIKSSYSNYAYINYNGSLGKIDMENYNYLYPIKDSEYDTDGIDKIYITSESSSIDITNIVKDFVRRHSESESAFNMYIKSNNEIDINGKKLIITNLYVRYDEDTLRIESYTINGYLLSM